MFNVATMGKEEPAGIPRRSKVLTVTSVLLNVAVPVTVPP